MADVVICYASDNQASARQLAEAIGREGWTVWHDQPSGAEGAGAVAAQVAAAKAAVVIWSASAAASPFVLADASVARGLGRLVQAGADDTPPPAPFEAGDVVSISTWLGDAAHPGWQRLRAAITSLAGPPPGGERTVFAPGGAPPAAPPEPTPAPTPAAGDEKTVIMSAPLPPPPPPPSPPPPAPEPAVAAAAPATGGKGRGGLVALLAILLLLIVGGAWAWMQYGPELLARMGVGGGSAEASATTNLAEPPPVPRQQPQQPQEAQQQPPPPLLDETPPAGGSGQASVGMSIAPAAGGKPAVPAVADTALADAGAPAAAASGGASRPAAPSARRERPRPPRVRYRNSEVMRQFCEGAGQGTRECRIFRANDRRR